MADPDQPGDGSIPGARVERMGPLRRRIAARLVSAQRDGALLTTFNEIDMRAVQELRAERDEAFRQKHGVKLGIMGFFVKAVVGAVQEVPTINAEIRGEDVVTWEKVHVGVAVGGGKGLVVPVLHDCASLDVAEIERRIRDYAERAKVNKLTLEELRGGTFTISNGGVYGSLLSTPIVNPPQSGILGLHAIQERPVARDGEVVIRPMMYVAVTYDHRPIDGREAVTFLRSIKDQVEAPEALLDAR